MRDYRIQLESGTMQIVIHPQAQTESHAMAEARAMHPEMHLTAIVEVMP